MKNGIHPAYHTAAKVVCACGENFTVGSTLPELHVEVCSKCHPFYTGKQNLVDTSGRIERFAKKMQARPTTAASVGKKVKAAKRSAHKAAKRATRATTETIEA